MQRQHWKKKVDEDFESEENFLQNLPLILSRNPGEQVIKQASSSKAPSQNKEPEAAPKTDSPVPQVSLTPSKKEPKKVIKAKKAAYVSMKNLLQEEDEVNDAKNEYVADSDEEVKAALANITDEDLASAWAKLHEHFLGKGESSFASSILASKPKIVNGLLELKVVNLIQKKNFEEFNEDLLIFVKNLLGVSKLKLNIEVEKNEDGSALPYTDKEKLLVMAKDNPALLTLQQTFGLEPEF